MEVRMEKKKARFTRGTRKPNIPWRILLAGLAVCLLAGGLVWRFGGRAAQADDAGMNRFRARYQMETRKDPVTGTDKSVFRIIEVVPDKKQAVLGFFIGGQEGKLINLELISALIKDDTWATYKTPACEYRQFFSWDEKEKGGREPFSVAVDKDQSVSVVNNEIFKLYMLGIGSYDPGKSLYDNLMSASNQNMLKTFDDQFIIEYEVLTARELSERFETNPAVLDHIQYLHIGNGVQIQGLGALYKEAAGDATFNGNTKFSEQNDITKYPGPLGTYAIIQKLYERALSSDNRLALSFNVGHFYDEGGKTRADQMKLNIFKLYAALNYFDDPRNFQEFYHSIPLPSGNSRPGKYTKNIEGNGYYIETKKYGTVVNTSADEKSVWDWECLDRLWGNVQGTASEPGKINAVSARRAGNYTPKALDNILLYSWYSEKQNPKEFMEDSQNIFAIHQILNPGPIPTPDNSEEEEDGSVKVLEIEPCNVYWLSDKDENLPNREKLAKALGVDETDLSVTCVTPNRLNGMTVDLAAEYDLIYIGNNTSLFREGSDFNNLQNAYRHIGTIHDAVIPQTLINGLLKDDYTTESKFNGNIGKKTPGAKLNIGSYLPSKSNPLFWNPKLREQLENLSGSFLKNVALSLELQSLGVDESVSKARFSGNDLTRYMQTQLAEFVRSGQPVIITSAVNQEAGKRYCDCVMTDLGGKEFEPTDERGRQDARLYLGLCGIDGGLEDERQYYKDNQLPINLGADPASTMENVYVRETTVDIIDSGSEGHVDLLKRFKPEIKVSDVSSENGQEADNSTILEKGTQGGNLDSLKKSNRLSFKYEITLPEGMTDPKKCVMKIIVDENGDGIFDSEGEGKTTVNGKKGSQNNAADMIKNDRVFEYDFSDAKLQQGLDYEYEPGKILGTWNADESVSAIEEFCQFRVVVTVKDDLYKLRGAWTGYMRPELNQKKVNILQIMPYSDKMKGVPLSKNRQFLKLIGELGNEREFAFDFDTGFTAMSEGDFTMACAGGEITADRLKTYDLIIVGTDFSPDISEDLTDMKDEKAAAVNVLKEYTDKLKRPIIFTNDAFSYVNSENYVAPEETKYHYRNLTLAEYKMYQNELTTDTTGKFKKFPLKANDYMGQKTINEEADAEGKDDEGTAYLEPDYKTIKVMEDLPYNIRLPGSYKALMIPITKEMAQDGRVVNDSVFLGSEWLGGIFSDGLKVKDTSGTSRELSFANIKSLLPAIVDSQGWFFNSYYYIREGYVTADELKNLYEKGVQFGPLRINFFQRYFYAKDLYPVLQTTEPINADSVNTESKISIAGKDYYEFQYNNKNYLAIQTEEETKEYYGYVWKIRVEGSGEDQLAPTYALTDVAGNSGALYPSKNNWNYFMTQSLRYAVGMDRFAVTTDMLESVDDMKSSDRIEDVKRDKGSSRRWAQVKEIQGFTDGALLEFAYLPPEGSALTGLDSTLSPYAAISLGTKPRTDCIEKLNDGVIGHYPYEISDPQNLSETRIPILENHPPYYQLDLERELGEGKIDDVTVWYTLTGSDDVKMKDVSGFFDITKQDAGNNYYLYSKGKTYYTGFSLHDEKGDSAVEGDDDLIPDMEMKLFINTIYAALAGESAADPAYYETMVQTGGTISQIADTKLLGDSNQYVCYYDDYGTNDSGSAELVIPFQISEKNAKFGEPNVSAAIGLDFGTTSGGAPQLSILPNFVLMSPEKTLIEVKEGKYSEIKVQKVTGDSASGENAGTDGWYQIQVPINLTADALDGKTIVIGPVVQPSDPTVFLDNAIFAKVRLVRRELFELE